MNIIKSQLTSLSRVARFFREKQKLQKSLVLLITQASLKKKDLIIKNKIKNFHHYVLFWPEKHHFTFLECPRS